MMESEGFFKSSYAHRLTEADKQPVVQTYLKVLEFFQDKSRFAQGYYNYDKDGNKCGWAEGYSFCTLGALTHFTEGESFRAQCCLQRVSEYLFDDAIQLVNDSPEGYEKVQQALKFAIELWKDHEPTHEELSMSIPDLLKKRNENLFP